MNVRKFSRFSGYVLHDALNETFLRSSDGLYPPLLGIIAIAEINEALNSGDHQQTLAALLLPTAKLTGVNPATAKHYHDVLQYTKELLCQVLSFSISNII